MYNLPYQYQVYRSYKEFASNSDLEFMYVDVMVFSKVCIFAYILECLSTLSGLYS
jgi:hypothetical protein